jgi:hypothetical protein
MIHCPGCGGRNPREALSCEWCRRPFIQLPQRGLSARWWGTLSGVVIAVLLILVGSLALLNASRASGRPSIVAPSASPSPIGAAQVASPSPVAAALASPSPSRTDGAAATQPAATATSALLPTPTPTARYARVANTNGLGANVRRAPATSSPVVTVAPENSIVQVLGPEQPGEGRVWRQVEDNRGNQGWVPADFLVDAPAPAGSRP